MNREPFKAFVRSSQEKKRAIILDSDLKPEVQKLVLATDVMINQSEDYSKIRTNTLTLRTHRAVEYIYAMKEFIEVFKTY